MFWIEQFAMRMDCFDSELLADSGYWIDKHEDNTSSTSPAVLYQMHRIF